MDLQQLFAQIKKQKQLAQPNLTQLRNYIKSAAPAASPLSLWQMNSTFRTLLSLGKAQIYLIAFAGLTVFPYVMYERYKAQPQKQTVITIATPIVSAITLIPLFYFRRFYRRLLTQISYDLATKQLILSGFNRNTPHQRVKPQNVKPIWTKNKRVKQIQVHSQGFDNKNNETNKKNIHGIQGVGSWHSLQTFRYLIQNKEL